MAVTVLPSGCGLPFCAQINKANMHFWPALMNPQQHLTAEPMAYATGSVEVVQLALQSSYDTWAVTPGSIEFIKAKIEDKLWPGPLLLYVPSKIIENMRRWNFFFFS